jgi:hypothetical protein
LEREQILGQRSLKPESLSGRRVDERELPGVERLPRKFDPRTGSVRVAVHLLSD